MPNSIADIGMSERDAAIMTARRAACDASDADVIRMLREYADDIEDDGRAHAPQWMREAANRLQMQLNNQPK